MTSEFWGDIQTCDLPLDVVGNICLGGEGYFRCPYMGLEANGSPVHLGSWRVWFPSEKGAG